MSWALEMGASVIRLWRGLSDIDWTLKEFSTGYGLWHAMSIVHFVVGSKILGCPTYIMTGMKFSKHGYPSRDSPNLHWVSRNK